MSVQLKTQHLLLKQATPKFAELTLVYYLRNREYIKGSGPEYKEEFFTLNGQFQRLRSVRRNTIQRRQLEFWIFKHGEERTIGKVNFFGICRGPVQSCELGYHMDVDETGQGLMTEACHAGIRHMFEEQGMHRVEANIQPRNVASLRVVEKLGFQREGLKRKYIKVAGSWEDHVSLALLNE